MTGNKDDCKSRGMGTVTLIAISIIAPLLDLKYKGLFYQVLPSKVQRFVDITFGHK